MQSSTSSLSSLRKWVHALVVSAIVLGILPPPMVATLANAALPQSIAEQVTQTTTSLLPAVADAKASALESSSASLLKKNIDRADNRTVSHSIEKPIEKPIESADASPWLAPFAQPSLTIGNSVWEDINGNGVQDSGEPGMAGVTVELMDGSGSPVMCTDAGMSSYYLDNFTIFPNGSSGTLT